VLLSFGGVVLSAIQFDCELQIRAVEIKDVRFHRMLAAAAQASP